jgi:hypothetical protein
VRRIHEIRVSLVLPLLLAVLMPMLAVAPAHAQDDPNDAPLGDVARNLRKKNSPPAQQVIDDDNLSKVMEQADSRRTEGTALRFVMAGESKIFQVSAPDATCSLSFSAGAKALLSSQYAQMNLPPGEVVKLRGPATIEGDALTVSVFNGTQWHVSEVTVALTIVNKVADALSMFDSSNALPAVPQLPAESEVRSDKVRPDQVRPDQVRPNQVRPEEVRPNEVRPEKKPDVTVIYRMRSAAPPWSTAVFSAPLNLDLDIGIDITAGTEWHWAIIEARGYPPQDYASSAPQTTAQTSQTAAPEHAATPVPVLPPNSPVASVPQEPR